MLTGPEHTLDWQLGGSYTSEMYIDNTDYSYMAGLVRGNYQYIFNPTTTFTEAIELLYDFSDSANYTFSSETALQTALSSILSFKVAYVVKYDNLPVPEILENTDTILSVALVASF